MMSIDKLLAKEILEKEDLIRLLEADRTEAEKIFQKAAEVKTKYIGNTTYFRGLIEYSSACGKNCYYCGIRKGNKNIHRYTLTDEQVLEAGRFALDNNYASLAIQSGEFETPNFTKKIGDLLDSLMGLSDNSFGITLSCGEQSEETYKTWHQKGASRYLLRIESSNKELYYKLHPNDDLHNYERRLGCLATLKKLGYQTGTGVMIGLPFQTTEDLANDLLFMRDFDIDMCGMGPYVEHHDTPLYEHRHLLMPLEERAFLSFKMVALLRIIMKDINIAATTAMQTVDKRGREKALRVGANIIMPNITPKTYRDDYALYENKPKSDDTISDDVESLKREIIAAGDEVGLGIRGDSKHYWAKQK
jgi:biotin synthase